MPKKGLPQNMQDWVAARKRHHLTHAQVQMARELGMKPKSLDKLDDHQPWKTPLPLFLEQLYLKRFGKERPDEVLSVEARARAQWAKKEARKQAKRGARAVDPNQPEDAQAVGEDEATESRADSCST